MPKKSAQGTKKKGIVSGPLLDGDSNIIHCKFTSSGKSEERRGKAFSREDEKGRVSAQRAGNGPE